jgi:hypothetical protein
VQMNERSHELNCCKIQKMQIACKFWGSVAPKIVRGVKARAGMQRLLRREWERPAFLVRFASRLRAEGLLAWKHDPLNVPFSTTMP